MKKITLSFLIMIIFTGCTPKSSVPVTQSPIETQELNTTTPTEVSVEVSDPFVITPDNLDQLELLDRWGKGFAYDMDISPDGKTVVVSTATGVYFYDMETLEESVILNEEFLRKKDGGQQASAVAFSPDGKYLAVANDRIYIWDLSENRVEKQIKNTMADFWITQIGFSIDSKQIVTMGYGGYVPCDAAGGNFQIFDIQKGNRLYFRYFCREDTIANFRVSANGEIFLTGPNPHGEFGGLETTVVEASTGQIIQIHGKQMIYDLSTDGVLAAIQPSYFDDKTTIIMEFNTQKVIKEIDGKIIFLPTPDFFIAQDEPGYTGWKLKDHNDNILCRFDDGENQLGLYVGFTQSRFKVRGKYLALMDYWRQEIQIWDTTNCEFVHRIPFPSGEYRPRFSPDGKTLAIDSIFYIHLWDTSTGEIRQSIPGSGNIGPIWKFSFNSTGTQIVAVTRDDPYILKFFDVNTGEVIKELDGDGTIFEDITVSPNGSFVATVGGDGLNVWDINSGSVYFSSYHFNLFSDNPFSPDGSKLAVEYKGVEGVLHIIDVENGTKQKIKIPNYGIDAISSDWKYYAVGDSDGFIYLWDLEKGVVLRKFIGHYRIADKFSALWEDITFSPDGHLIVSLKGDQVRFWDVQTGALVGEIDPNFSIDYIDFSPDGHLLATTGDDGTIRIWGIPQP